MIMRVLILGDIVGAPGQAIFQKHINKIKADYNIDAVIVNGENSADGKGITPRIMNFFKHNGVDLVTSGNHIWQKKEICNYLSEQKDLLRPANFPAACPGSGVGLFTAKNGATIGVINVQGRVFMRELVSCPFKAIESALIFLKTKTPIVIIDIHAETTSEKMALAYNFDGQVTAVVGTHTHVPTADERILPKGTAYITDLGMAGALHSVLGVKKQAIIYNMTTQMPTRFEVETEPPYFLSGVWIAIDTITGKAVDIGRIYIVDEHIRSESI